MPAHLRAHRRSRRVPSRARALPPRLPLRALLLALALVVPLVVLAGRPADARAAAIAKLGSYDTGDFSDWQDPTEALYRPWTGHVGSAAAGYPVLPGHRYSARFEIRPGDYLWGRSDEERSNVVDGDPAQPRFHDDGLERGKTRYFTHSIFFPRGFPTQHGWACSFEIHQRNTLLDGRTIGYTGPAPFVLDFANDSWRVIVRGGDPYDNGGRWTQKLWGGVNPAETGYAGKLDVPFTRGVWHDWTFGIHFASDSSGWVEVYYDGRLVVPRTSTPTTYANQGNMVVAGLYRKGGGVNPDDEVAYEGGGAVFDNLGDALAYQRRGDLAAGFSTTRP